jgi:hypothetical protein
MNSLRWRARNDHIHFGNADRNGDQYEKDTTTKTRHMKTVSILIIDEDGEVLFETGTKELAKEYDVAPTPADLVEAIKDELNGRFYTQEKSPN